MRTDLSGTPAPPFDTRPATRRGVHSAALILFAMGLVLGAGVPQAAAQGKSDAWNESDTWPFSPAPDEFEPDALLDLRHLNEPVAGQHGFVKLDGRGGLLRGDGRPLRFWAVNSEVGRGPHTARPLWPGQAPDLGRHARFLAKRGVNLVRLHRQIPADLQRQPRAELDDINPQEREGLWRAVAAYRRAGIYTAISPYWAVPMKFRAEWGIAAAAPASGGDARRAEQSALGLLFFDDRLRAAYKAWMRQLLAEPNPHTGVPLARDPAVALIQIQNEDSLLFWTVDRIQGAQRRALEARFARFAADRHGSVTAALRAWGGPGEQDAPGEGRLALRIAWELTQPPRSAAHGQRLADQTAFLTRLMHDFNADITRYLKQELGVGSLVNAGNWRTASAVRLWDAERWSYTASDVDAVNRYTTGLHEGQHANWAIVAGDRYTAHSVLKAPHTLPVAIKHTAGRPMLLTEGAWVPPNPHAAEGPLLVAAYGALGGLDGYCWFATGEEGWGRPRSANGYLPSLAKWTVTTPETLGGFPAAALAFREGYIRPGEVVVHERRTLASLWQREPARIAEEPGFDPNRDLPGQMVPAGGTDISPAAFLVGQVLVGFGDKPSEGAAPDTKAMLRRAMADGRIRSTTGELSFDAVQGWARIDAPRVQAVAAHFGGAPVHALADVSFRSGNAYGAAWAVSLDGQPLKTSSRILLQYTTQSRPSGWLDQAASWQPKGGAKVDGREIVHLGGPPWRVERARLEVEVRNPQLSRATALDANGRAVGEVPLERGAAGVRLKMPPDALYVMLR